MILRWQLFMEPEAEGERAVVGGRLRTCGHFGSSSRREAEDMMMFRWQF